MSNDLEIRSQKQGFLCFLLSLFCILFMVACSNQSQKPYAFFANPLSSQINNLLDFNGDKKSEFILWNTSSMSKPDKFLEPCFFEAVNIAKGEYLKFNNTGEVGDIPFVGYFDSDGIIDYGTYRYDELSNRWTIMNGVENSGATIEFGEASDLPVPNDYNGDGKFDITVYRSRDSTFKGFLNNIPFLVSIGASGDFPTPKDYDGDGHADFATYRLSDGTWTIKNSSNSAITESMLGDSSSLPIPADYDGDGKADLCVWNPNDNSLKAILTTLSRPLSIEVTNKIQKELKSKNFFPVPADYDGDGACELSFWESSLKTLLCFDIRLDLKKKVYHFKDITNSVPVNNFLLKRFLFKNKLKSALMDSADNFVSDFDGDYDMDTCKWSKNTGTFLCKSSRLGWKFALHMGESTDKPVVGNFNSDYITDIGVYRPSTQTFYIRYLGKLAPQEIKIVQLSKDAGLNAIPKIDDYDKDGIDDFAVFNPEKDILVIKKSTELMKKG